VIVSPEIAGSPAFRKAVISKAKFYSRVWAVCVDEAHCISLWGGSFRPDYADLGVLRGRFPSHIPFIVASATLPEHVLDDIRSKLQLSKDAVHVSVSNARPNVALSCRAMRHSEESKGDLRFLIPRGAKQIKDVPITLVYCNQ
jgi:superfamily II DNA helicase RecQ